MISVSNSFNAMALAGNIFSWLQITHATTKHYIKAHDSGGSQTKTHRPNLTSLVNNHIKYTEAQGSAHTQDYTIHRASPVYSLVQITNAVATVPSRRNRRNIFSSSVKDHTHHNLSPSY